MTDNKITNDEILSEEQLEEVAGGSLAEIKNDICRFKMLGVLPNSTDEVDEGALRWAFGKFNINADTKYASLNKYTYRIDGKEYDRNTVWNYICDKMNRPHF